eukprot:39185-Ditylum_brightwellii.AAC.1
MAVETMMIKCVFSRRTNDEFLDDVAVVNSCGYNNEQKDFNPDNISYNAVVHAWGHSRYPSTARRAEAILRCMEW